MGLRGGRIGFAALTLAALLLPLWKRDAVAPAATDPVDHGARLDALSWREYTTATVWSQLLQRDSALAYLDRARATGPAPQIVLQGFPAGYSSPKTEAAVAALWRSIGKTDSALNVIVLLQNEDAIGVSKIQWGRYRGAMFTERDGRPWCVAIVGSYHYANNQPTVSASDASFEAAISPCALRAAFGPPGAAIQQWLTATRYLGAQSDEWLNRPRNYHDQMGPWEKIRSTRATDLPRNAFFEIAGETGALDLAALMRPPYEYGSDGVRCLDGHSAACATMVLRPAAATWVDRFIPPDMTMPAYFATDDSTTFATVRGPRPTLVAGLINQYGRDRFQKFWTSDQPFEIAFRNAFGESLGEGVERWAKAEWLATHDAQFRSAAILTGATLRLPWIPLVVVYSTLALVIAAAVARRREAAS